MSYSMSWNWTRTENVYILKVCSAPLAVPSKSRTHCRFLSPLAGPAAAFLNSLGTPVHLPVVESSSPQPIRPMTPGKTPKVDYDKVRQNLHELWVTEESYLRKLSSLYRVRPLLLLLLERKAECLGAQDYALPLRSFSKKRDTAIIPAFEANHLFINIEQLVPVAEAFERDLHRLADQLQRDRTKLPAGFGEIIMSHVRPLSALNL